MQRPGAGTPRTALVWVEEEVGVERKDEGGLWSVLGGGQFIQFQKRGGSAQESLAVLVYIIFQTFQKHQNTPPSEFIQYRLLLRIPKCENQTIELYSAPRT